MRTLAEVDSEISNILIAGGNAHASKSELKRYRERLSFLKMVKLCLESCSTESIVRSYNETNAKIAIHEQRIEEITRGISSRQAAALFANDYGKKVGLPHLYEYRKTLSFICEQPVLDR